MLRKIPVARCLRRKNGPKFEIYGFTSRRNRRCLRKTTAVRGLKHMKMARGRAGNNIYQLNKTL